MLTADDKQFQISPGGEILFQPLPGNPLPGQPVALIRKGASPLAPDIEITGADQPPETSERLHTWLKARITAVLEPLVALSETETLPEGPAREICTRVYNSLGIVRREEIEDLAAALGPEDRALLRSKKIRLGPLLVFQPDLNKPAAVRLRGLLWSLYNGRALPAPVPSDGAVSVAIDPATADPDFYRAIGYPAFGPRAIRIDMLDRVINSVYENAKDGKFQARHQMAEWLGCPITDLYEILTAMGHTKIFDPADQPVAESPAAPSPGEEPAQEIPTAPPVEENSEATPAEKPVAPPQPKPELATFRLKKGKAFEKAASPRVYTPRPERMEKAHPDKKPDRKRTAEKGDRREEGKNRREKTAEKHTDKRPTRRTEFGPSPKIEDSPFAILQRLKAGNDDG
ncbi:MAG: hypothetical protein K9G62_04555 [Alphaproteobacteria bacterium]|nr:hypothetical protein [Alphaproteobacteria bacterium]